MSLANFSTLAAFGVRLTGEAVKTVALLNGSVFNSRQWNRAALPVLDKTIGKKFRFLQYDYPGFGASPARTGPWNMALLADELAALLDALSIEKAHFLGISQGSLVGQAMLIRHPHRVLSFCGVANPYVDAELFTSVARLFADRFEALEGLRDLWPEKINGRNITRIMREVYAPALFLGRKYPALSFRERLTLRLVQHIVSPMLRGTPVASLVDLFRYYGNGIVGEEKFFREGIKTVPREIPVLLLHGTSDRTIPIEMSRLLKSAFPQAELVEFPGVDHMTPMLIKSQGEKVFGRYAEWVAQINRKF